MRIKGGVNLWSIRITEISLNKQITHFSFITVLAFLVSSALVCCFVLFKNAQYFDIYCKCI